MAELQLLGAGLGIGMYVLEQLLPGSSAVTPIAGTLIARGYSRNEEYEADRHAVEILRRTDYSKETLIDALRWVARFSNAAEADFSPATPPPPIASRD